MGRLLIWNKKFDNQCFCEYCTEVPGWREYLDGETCPYCERGVLHENETFGGWLVCTECNFETKGVEETGPTGLTEEPHEPNN